ncbi:acyl-CoA carboxylase subunit epsilon [Kutzneria kofuensis]|uniref:acyl-CoA carboxylase subunit epsilon n=1 Tax=Kutzneria kofuensis TaxID=103725 RepID=UPI0033863ED7
MSDDRPLLRVVRGNPDDTELAVLTAVMSAIAAVPAVRTNPPRRPAGARRSCARPLHPGPGAWQYSFR